MFSPHQETLIVDMVRENNAIKLSEIQQKIIEDHVNFQGINSVSLSTVDRVLKRNRLRMKQLYRVPFDRNSDRVKEQRFQYVQVGRGADSTGDGGDMTPPRFIVTRSVPPSVSTKGDIGKQRINQGFL